MDSIIEKVFYTYFDRKASDKSISKIKNEIEVIKKQLKKTFSKKQRKLLLRIEDKKDLINEISSSESFIAGFKIGLKVGFEVNED